MLTNKKFKVVLYIYIYIQPCILPAVLDSYTVKLGKSFQQGAGQAVEMGGSKCAWTICGAATPGLIM